MENKRIVRPTRFYSKRQEDKIAKAVGGKRVANSGATAFSKGDVNTDIMLIEAKTHTTHKSSFSIKEEWLLKNVEEAFAMNKDYSALAFSFGPDEDNYYVISEDLFLKLLTYLKGEGNE